MTPANRRQFERFPFSSRLEVRRQRAAAQHAGPQLARGLAFDVSVSGFGFRSEMPLTVGDVIAVTLATVDDDGLGDSDPRQNGPSQNGHKQNGASKAAADPWLEILAVVRRVSRDNGEYVVGAERHADGN